MNVEVDKKSRAHTENFINKYVAPAIAHLSFGKMIDNKKIEIFATPDVPSAQVTYDQDKKKFLIFIGTEMSVYQNTRYERDIKGLVKFLLMHECAHILFTSMDFEKLNNKLQEAGVPFDFLNLAEDVRINHNIVQFYKRETGVEEKLNIEKYKGGHILEEADMNPEAILYAIGVIENSRPIKALLYSEVLEFYQRFIRAKNVYEVVVIAEDWKNHFHGKSNINNDNSLFSEPTTAEKGADGGISASGESMGESEKSMRINMDELGEDLGLNDEDEGQSKINGMDLTDMEEMSGEGDAIDIEELMKNAISASNSDMQQSSVTCKVDTSKDFTSLAGASNSEKVFYKNGQAGEFDTRAVTEEILPELRKIEAETKSKTIAVKKPTKRFNKKKLPMSPISLNTTLYRKKVIAPLKIGKKKVTFLCDLSGSMNGKPVRELRTLLISLNRLAKMFPELELTIVGSKISGDESLFQGVLLPTDENILLSVRANGAAEGLGYALSSMAKKPLSNSYHLKDQDTLVVISDGNMRQQDIRELKKALSDDLGRKTNTIGVYVGHKHMSNMEMEGWFDKYISNESLVDVVKEIVSQINNKKTFLREKNIPQEVNESINTNMKI